MAVSLQINYIFYSQITTFLNLVLLVATTLLFVGAFSLSFSFIAAISTILFLILLIFSYFILQLFSSSYFSSLEIVVFGF